MNNNNSNIVSNGIGNNIINNNNSNSGSSSNTTNIIIRNDTDFRGSNIIKSSKSSETSKNSKTETYRDNNSNKMQAKTQTEISIRTQTIDTAQEKKNTTNVNTKNLSDTEIHKNTNNTLGSNDNLERVLVYLSKNNDSNEIEQIGCIVLSSDNLSEIESYSMNLSKVTKDSTQESQWKTIYDILNARLWIGINIEENRKLIENLFESHQAKAPQSGKLFELTSLLSNGLMNDKKVETVFDIANQIGIRCNRFDTSASQACSLMRQCLFLMASNLVLNRFDNDLFNNTQRSDIGIKNENSNKNLMSIIESKETDNSDEKIESPSGSVSHDVVNEKNDSSDNSNDTRISNGLLNPVSHETQTEIFTNNQSTQTDKMKDILPFSSMSINSINSIGSINDEINNDKNVSIESLNDILEKNNLNTTNEQNKQHKQEKETTTKEETTQISQPLQATQSTQSTQSTQVRQVQSVPDESEQRQPRKPPNLGRQRQRILNAKKTVELNGKNDIVETEVSVENNDNLNENEENKSESVVNVTENNENNVIVNEEIEMIKANDRKETLNPQRPTIPPKFNKNKDHLIGIAKLEDNINSNRSGTDLDDENAFATSTSELGYTHVNTNDIINRQEVVTQVIPGVPGVAGVVASNESSTVPPGAISQTPPINAINNGNNINTGRNEQVQQVQQLQQSESIEGERMNERNQGRGVTGVWTTHNTQLQGMGGGVQTPWSKIAKRPKPDSPMKVKPMQVIISKQMKNGRNNHMGNNNNNNNNNGNNNYRGRGPQYSFETTRVPAKIRGILTEAMHNSRTVWVSYDGHMRPKVPRGIIPKYWENTKNKVVFQALPLHSKSNKTQKFELKLVLEIRDRPWRKDNNQRRYYGDNAYNGKNNNNRNRSSQHRNTGNNHNNRKFQQDRGDNKHNNSNRDNNNKNTNTSNQNNSKNINKHNNNNYHRNPKNSNKVMNKNKTNDGNKHNNNLQNSNNNANNPGGGSNINNNNNNLNNENTKTYRHHRTNGGQQQYKKKEQSIKK